MGQAEEFVDNICKILDHDWVERQMLNSYEPNHKGQPSEVTINVLKCSRCGLYDYRGRTF